MIAGEAQDVAALLQGEFDRLGLIPGSDGVAMHEIRPQGYEVRRDMMAASDYFIFDEVWDEADSGPPAAPSTEANSSEELQDNNQV